MNTTTEAKLPLSSFIIKRLIALLLLHYIPYVVVCCETYEEKGRSHKVQADESYRISIWPFYVGVVCAAAGIGLPANGGSTGERERPLKGKTNSPSPTRPPRPLIRFSTTQQSTPGIVLHYKYRIKGKGYGKGGMEWWRETNSDLSSSLFSSSPDGRRDLSRRKRRRENTD